jgi:hypothetical protein
MLAFIPFLKLSLVLESFASDCLGNTTDLRVHSGCNNNAYVFVLDSSESKKKLTDSTFASTLSDNSAHISHILTISQRNSFTLEWLGPVRCVKSETHRIYLEALTIFQPVRFLQ